MEVNRGETMAIRGVQTSSVMKIHKLSIKENPSGGEKFYCALDMNVLVPKQESFPGHEELFQILTL